jgi:hypothetical protein
LFSGESREGPLPLTGVAPQSQPLPGMLLRPSTDIHPKELARDMRGFSTVS